jgi:hypothetical protein
MVEEQAYFRYHKRSGYDQTSQKVIDSIGLQSKYASLGTGKDDRFSQVAESEREGGGGIGQTVGPMKDDKAIEEGVVCLNSEGNLGPAGGGDRGAVE